MSPSDETPSRCEHSDAFLTQWGSGAHDCSPAMTAVVATVMTATEAVKTAMMTTMMTTATASRLTTAVPAVNITAVFTVRVVDAAWKQI